MAYDEATDVTAEQGLVHLDGPDGVAVAMTPRAATETGKRLTRAAIEAHAQRLPPGVKSRFPKR